jgi:hypothetical protein
MNEKRTVIQWKNIARYIAKGDEGDRVFYTIINNVNGRPDGTMIAIPLTPSEQQIVSNAKNRADIAGVIREKQRERSMSKSGASYRRVAQ